MCIIVLSAINHLHPELLFHLLGWPKFHSARVLYDFSSMAEGDLSVKADELVEIVCMFEDGWSKCRLLIDQSQEGFIPTAFLLVDQVEDGAEEEEETIPDQPSYPPQQSFEVEMIVDIRSPLSSSIYSPSGPLVSS